MALFDELEGLLGAEATAKMSPEIKQKLGLADSLIDYYDGTTNELPAKPAPRAAEGGSGNGSGTFDLDALDKILEKRIGNIDEKIKTGIEEGIKARGGDLLKSATDAALNTSLSIGRVAAKHQTTFGETLDTDALNVWATEEQKKGRRFGSVEEAYDAYTQPRVIEKVKADARAEGAREALKDRATHSVPGYTPPSAKSAIAVFSQRGKTETSGSAISAAAAELSARRAAANQ